MKLCLQVLLPRPLQLGIHVRPCARDSNLAGPFISLLSSCNFLLLGSARILMPEMLGILFSLCIVQRNCTLGQGPWSLAVVACGACQSGGELFG